MTILELRTLAREQLLQSPSGDDQRDMGYIWGYVDGYQKMKERISDDVLQKINKIWMMVPTEVSIEEAWSVSKAKEETLKLLKGI